MADPVSVIAGLVGVGQTVYAVVESLEGISESVDSAHDDIKLLSSDLGDIRLLTEYLQQKARAIESINRAVAQSCHETVQRCIEKLNSIVVRIRKHLQDCGLHLHHRYGRRQTFASAWRKYKWHRKRPLLRELRQDLQDVTIKLNTVMQMLSMETRRGSSTGGNPAAFEDQRSSSQSQQSEAHLKHYQRRRSLEQQRPSASQDNTQPTNIPVEEHGPHRTREDVAAVFDSFSPSNNASEPQAGDKPGVDVVHLKLLLSLFPWPPPEWDTLELSAEDSDMLRQLNFTNQTTICRLSAHINESDRYREANRRLLTYRKRTERGKSGLGNWIRKQYWWHACEISLKNGYPGIRMGEFDYCAIEDALRCGIGWQNALRTLMNSEIGPSRTESILKQLWTYLSGGGPVSE